TDDLVTARPIAGPAEELRRLLERHVRYTGSARAAELLEDWAAAVRSFVRVAPKTDVARLEDEHEGTLGLDADVKRVGKGKTAQPEGTADDSTLAPEVAQAAQVGK